MWQTKGQGLYVRSHGVARDEGVEANEVARYRASRTLGDTKDRMCLTVFSTARTSLSPWRSTAWL
jgi:hypothetical protein